MLVVDPALLSSGEDFRRRVAECAASIRAARPIDPDATLRIPFDRSAAERAHRLAEGEIEVSDEVHDGLLAVLSGAADAGENPHSIIADESR